MSSGSSLTECSLAGGLTGGVPNADVEDVAFGIGQGRPSRPVLVEFSDLGGPESDRALDFGWEVSRDKIKVQPILALAWLGYAQNINAGKVPSSEAGTRAKNWLAPSLTGRSTRADQKAAISSARRESMTTWPNPIVTVVFLS